jgi:hypothetical protein
MVLVLGGVLVVALAIAFAAQSLASPRRRTRIILATAAAPSIVLISLTAIPAAGDESLSGFQIVVSLAMALGAFLFVGLVGAIAGSELASLARWLLHRQR